MFSSEADRSSAGRSVYAIQADGSGEANLLLRAGAVSKFPETVTQDGRRIIYVERASTGDWDLMEVLLPPAGEALPSSPPAPTVLLKTAFSEIDARLSPTNQWMAYGSDESGRYEVYVRPYPNVQAGRFQISTEGARTARWSTDGRELFYVSLDNILMAVRVEPGPAWRASPPTRVISMESYLTAFDVSGDGQRFLVIKEAAGSALVARNLVLVQNFTEELKRLVPTN
jgi:serine/threonine-protein kinase